MQDIIELFESVDEAERREMLSIYAEGLQSSAPDPAVKWDVADVRRDPECSDEVGIFLKFDESGEKVTEVAASVGPGVRTMTRSLLAIVCKGMSGEPRAAFRALEEADLAPIAGPELMALRSRTVAYVARRFREASLR